MNFTPIEILVSENLASAAGNHEFTMLSVQEQPKKEVPKQVISSS